MLFRNLLLTLAFVFSIGASGQTDQNVTLTSITKSGHEIFIEFSTDQTFIIGDNRYILHVGPHHILRSTHPEGNISRIAFIVDEDEFNTLQDGVEMMLVYGLYDRNKELHSESGKAQFDGQNWTAGKLNKSLLKQ